MGYFFVALIGGIWLLFKIAKDKNDAKFVQQEYDNWRNKINGFNNKYATNASTFDEMLSDGRITSDKIYELIGKELKAVFGDDYKSKFPLPGTPGYKDVSTNLKNAPSDLSEAYDNINWAWLIWLSKKGKVPQQSGTPSDWITLGVKQFFENEEPFEIINRNISFCKIIEDNLKKNKAKITIVGMPGNHRDTFLNGNSETRVAIYECLREADKKYSKRLW